MEPMHCVNCDGPIRPSEVHGELSKGQQYRFARIPRDGGGIKNTLDLRDLESMESLWTYKVVTDRIGYCDSGFVAPHGAVPGLLCAKCWGKWEESQRRLNLTMLD